MRPSGWIFFRRKGDTCAMHRGVVAWVQPPLIAIRNTYRAGDVTNSDEVWLIEDLEIYEQADYPEVI